MNTIRRYLGVSIYQLSALVLTGFLALFFFVDLVAEIDEVIGGKYGLREASVNIFLGIPARLVELMPIGFLIGGLWALSRSALDSEMAVLRASGLSPVALARALLVVGLFPIIFISIFSELLVPKLETLKVEIFGGVLASGSVSGRMQSGIWLKDSSSIKDSDPPLNKMGARFINARRFNSQKILENVSIYDFDQKNRLTQILYAQRASYLGNESVNKWILKDVEKTGFLSSGGVILEKMEMTEVISSLTPEMLDVLVTNPDRMSSFELFKYLEFLRQNKQETRRYEVSFWKRIVYPFSLWVMLFLALPAAFLQPRSGSVSVIIICGVGLGLTFHLLNSLFSHIGVLSTWPAPVMVMLPSLIALTVAAGFFYWVQYR